MMTQTLLAQAAVAGLDPVTVGTIIGGVITALIGGGLIGKKSGRAEGKAEAMMIGPQPFMVDIKKEFITRAEHDVYRAEVRADFQRMEGSIIRMSDKVETKHLELLATIERAASSGVNGRVAIWESLKPLGNEVAALKATSNVAAQLEKLAEAITANHQSNGKTTR